MLLYSLNPSVALLHSLRPQSLTCPDTMPASPAVPCLSAPGVSATLSLIKVLKSIKLVRALVLAHEVHVLANS